MNMGSALSPTLAVNSPASSATSMTDSSNERLQQPNDGAELRSDVQLQFMRMMETHDRVRARLLGSSLANSYSTSVD